MLHRIPEPSAPVALLARIPTLLGVIVVGAALSSCGGSDSSDSGAVPLTVPKVATCGAYRSRRKRRCRARSRPRCGRRLQGLQLQPARWSASRRAKAATGRRRPSPTAAAATARITGPRRRTRTGSTPGVPVIDMTDRDEAGTRRVADDAGDARPVGVAERQRAPPVPRSPITARTAAAVRKSTSTTFRATAASRSCWRPSPSAPATTAASSCRSRSIGHEGNMGAGRPHLLHRRHRATARRTTRSTSPTRRKPKLISTLQHHGRSAWRAHVHGLSVSNDGNRGTSSRSACRRSAAPCTDPNVPPTTACSSTTLSEIQAAQAECADRS